MLVTGSVFVFSDETSLQFVLGAVKDSSYLLIKVGNESKDLNTLNYNAAAAAAAEANYDSSIPMAFSSSVSANSSNDKMASVKNI